MNPRRMSVSDCRVIRIQVVLFRPRGLKFFGRGGRIERMIYWNPLELGERAEPNQLPSGELARTGLGLFNRRRQIDFAAQQEIGRAHV